MSRFERKFGKYAIRNLSVVLVCCYAIGYTLQFIVPWIAIYLSLDPYAILHGQVWRLFTFLIEPYGFSRGMGMLVSILFFAIQVHLFFLFGRSLEQAWGTFRFNLYFFFGYILNIMAALILYLSPLHLEVYHSGFQYIYWSMFFAFYYDNTLTHFIEPQDSS